MVDLSAFVVNHRGHVLRPNYRRQDGLEIYVVCDVCRLVTKTDREGQVLEDVWTCDQHLVNQVHRD